MQRQVEEEEANWTKAISGLTITKCGLIFYIVESLKNFLYTFSPDQIDHLSKFFDNTRASKLEFKIEQNKTCWKIAKNCCQTGLCQTILDRLWEEHENKSKYVVWRPIVETSELYTKNKKKVALPYTYYLNKECSVCGELDCLFERNRNGFPLYDDTLQQGDVDKYYWEIANMYMFHGKEKIKIPITGPKDTDVALIFKLMKNCKLFSLQKENDIDISIYDDLLEVRNLLMHSADNRLTDEALEECFDRMKRILKAKKFSSKHSRNAIIELEKLKDMRIIMTSLTSQQADLVKEAFNLQQSSVEFDIHVTGSLKNDFVLEGILKASKENSRKYTRSAEQTPAPSSQTRSPPSQTRSPPSQTRSPPSQTRSPPSQSSATTLGGAATGAAVGSIAGPPGAAIGAAVGWLFGKLAE